MALFGKKKNTADEKEAIKTSTMSPVATLSSASSPRPVRVSSASHVLIAPRITEKGAFLAESGCYVFNVRPSANKRQVALAIKEVFNVEPRMVRMARIPRKVRQTRGTNRMGLTAGGKKAYVYLKKGDKIELA